MKSFSVLDTKIHLGENIFSYFEAIISEEKNASKLVIITDENVEKIHGGLLRQMLTNIPIDSHIITLSAGEQYKDLPTLAEIYNELSILNFTKSDLLVAFGGGVVGDITGFAAATFLRGVTYFQIPTTLTAQVDSSIGGKTAIDLPMGKNLVGAFYHPKAILIDTNFLATLPDKAFSDGMGEVIKYACIQSPDLFEKLEALTPITIKDELSSIVEECAKIKIEYVEEDEKDNGKRMILNFGHTIGHAIEKACNFEDITHGEAVAIGMYNITKASEVLGLTLPNTSEMIKDLLVKYALSYELPEGISKEHIYKFAMADKKSRGELLNIILIKKIGKAFIHQIKRSEFIDYI